MPMKPRIHLLKILSQCTQVGDQESRCGKHPYRGRSRGDVRPRFLVDADVVVIASTAIVLLIDATELSRIAYTLDAIPHIHDSSAAS